MSTDRTPLTIVVPGRGVLNLDAERVNRAIMEYDERLRFGFNPVNQDWVIYIKMPRNFDAAYFIEGEPVYPVLGFGQEIPDPLEAVVRLRRADTLQHGMRILTEMNRQNQNLLDAGANEASDIAGDVAERIEHEVRKAGHAEKYAKVHFMRREE